MIFKSSNVMIEEWYLTSEYCGLSVFFDLCFFLISCFIVSIEIRDLLIRILEFGLIVLLFLVQSSHMWGPWLVAEWSSLERSLAAEFRQGWDRYMMAMCSFRSWRVGQHSFWIRMCWSRQSFLAVVVELESSWTPVSCSIAPCVCSGIVIYGFHLLVSRTIYQ